MMFLLYQLGVQYLGGNKSAFGGKYVYSMNTSCKYLKLQTHAILYTNSLVKSLKCTSGGSRQHSLAMCKSVKGEFAMI